MHETQIRIRSTQVDTFGHLNNAAYLEVFEWARWEWAESLGMDINRISEKERMGPAVMHVDLSFFKEVHMHETVTIRTWFDQIERVKGVMGQELFKEDGLLAASALITFVMFHLDKRKVLPMPSFFQEAWEHDEQYRLEKLRSDKKKPYGRSSSDK